MLLDNAGVRGCVFLTASIISFVSSEGIPGLPLSWAILAAGVSASSVGTPSSRRESRGTWNTTDAPPSSSELSFRDLDTAHTMMTRVGYMACEKDELSYANSQSPSCGVGNSR